MPSDHDCWEWAVYDRKAIATGESVYVCVKCQRSLYRDGKAKK